MASLPAGLGSLRIASAPPSTTSLPETCQVGNSEPPVPHPLGDRNWMPLKAVSAGKSLTVACGVPSKARLSPGSGALPLCQLAASLQRLLLPPPVQERTSDT